MIQSQISRSCWEAKFDGSFNGSQFSQSSHNCFLINLGRRDEVTDVTQTQTRAHVNESLRFPLSDKKPDRVEWSPPKTSTLGDNF